VWNCRMLVKKPSCALNWGALMVPMLTGMTSAVPIRRGWRSTPNRCRGPAQAQLYSGEHAVDWSETSQAAPRVDRGDP